MAGNRAYHMQLPGTKTARTYPLPACLPDLRRADAPAKALPWDVI